MAMSAGARTGSYRIASLPLGTWPEIETGRVRYVRTRAREAGDELRPAYRLISRRSQSLPAAAHLGGSGQAAWLESSVSRPGPSREGNAVMAPCRRPGTCRRHGSPRRPRGVTGDHGACARAATLDRARGRVHPGTTGRRAQALRAIAPRGHGPRPAHARVTVGRARPRVAVENERARRPLTRPASTVAPAVTAGSNDRPAGRSPEISMSDRCPRDHDPSL